MPLLLDPADPLSEVVLYADAATRAGVTHRTLRRWINNGHLTPIPGAHQLVFTLRALLECERDRHLASRAGRPGARPRLDVLTLGD